MAVMSLRPSSISVVVSQPHQLPWAETSVLLWLSTLKVVPLRTLLPVDPPAPPPRSGLAVSKTATLVSRPPRSQPWMTGVAVLATRMPGEVPVMVELDTVTVSASRFLMSRPP